MQAVYVVCAMLGGTVMVWQFVMTLFGFGDHDVAGHDGGMDGHDFDHGSAGHHDVHDANSWLVGVISFRTIMAAMAFFGLAGLGMQSAGVAPAPGFAISAAVGFSAMMFVAYVMRGLTRLSAEGTARIERAVGANGTVYLTIPAGRAGVGKVTLKIQGRTMEYQAVTGCDTDLPTGTEVVAVSVVAPGTVEVAPVCETERVAHA